MVVTVIVTPPHSHKQRNASIHWYFALYSIQASEIFNVHSSCHSSYHILKNITFAAHRVRERNLPAWFKRSMKITVSTTWHKSLSSLSLSPWKPERRQICRIKTFDKSDLFIYHIYKGLSLALYYSIHIK